MQIFVLHNMLCNCIMKRKPEFIQLSFNLNNLEERYLTIVEIYDHKKIVYLVTIPQWLNYFDAKFPFYSFNFN